MWGSPSRSCPGIWAVSDRPVSSRRAGSGARRSAACGPQPSTSSTPANGQSSGSPAEHMTISNESRSTIKKVFEPIALGMGRLGLTPDGLTLIGFAITVVGAALLAGQLWLAGGIIVFVGGVFDMFDGTLARATGKASTLGAFMDSVFDRWGEAIVYLGIVIGAQGAGVGDATILAAAALGAAFMVSYTRAKSEGLGFSAGSGMAA